MQPAFTQIDLSSKIKDGETIYYYSFFSYFSQKMKNLLGKCSESSIISSWLNDFKILLLIFDRILIPIEHILSLIKKEESRVFTTFFNEPFTKEAIEDGRIIFSVWHTREKIETKYLIEITKEYLIKSGWNISNRYYIPAENFPVKSERIFIFMRKVADQSKMFQEKVINSLDVLLPEKNLREIVEIEKAIQNGEWEVISTDATIPFSLEKLYIEYIKEEGQSFKFWEKTSIEEALNTIIIPEYFYAGEQANGRIILVPCERSSLRKTYDGRIYAILLRTHFIEKTLEYLLELDIRSLISHINYTDLVNFRKENNMCFNILKNYVLQILQDITKYIDQEVTRFQQLRKDIEKPKFSFENYSPYKYKNNEEILEKIRQSPIQITLFPFPFTIDPLQITKLIYFFIKKIKEKHKAFLTFPPDDPKSTLSCIKKFKKFLVLIQKN